MAARSKKMTNELLPETVTVEGFENLSMITGIMTFTATLANDVVNKM